MKIIFDRLAFLNIAGPLMCATTSKSGHAELEGILIDAKQPDVCTMTTYDLEKGVQIIVSAQVIEEGRFIINAQKLIQTMRVMDGEEVMLTVDSSNNTAVIQSGRSSHKMMALRGEGFPELPHLTSDRGFSIGAGILKDMISKTMYAMGVTDQRNVLNGAYFEVEDKRLQVVACDSFKLAKCILNTEIQNHNEDGSDLRYRFIVPVKTVNELYKLLPADEDCEIRIHVTRKHIVYYIGGIIFFSRLVDGQYIDFDRIIMRQHKIYATMDKESLLSALERAALITEERISHSVRSHVKLILDGGLLKVVAESSAGSTYDEIEVEHEGGDLIIAFNNKFLIDSVRACDCDRLRLALSSPLTSVNIEPADGESSEREDLFMLLPVRMKE